MEEKILFEGNSSRSKLYERFDLVPPIGIKLIAQRFALGSEQHGEENWKGGGPEFVKATKNHLLSHVLKYLEVGSDVEHEGPGGNLGAIGWAVCALAWFEQKK